MNKIALVLLVTMAGLGRAAEMRPAASPPEQAAGAQASQKVKAGDPAPLGAIRQFGKDPEVVFLKYYCGRERKYTAQKAVLVDFFSAADPTAPSRLSALQALAAKYAKHGLTTFPVSVDPDPERTLPGLLRKGKVTFPVYTDRARALFSEYGFPSAPQAVLLDEECRIVYLEKKGGRDYTGLEDSLAARLKPRAQEGGAVKPQEKAAPSQPAKAKTKEHKK